MANLPIHKHCPSLRPAAAAAAALLCACSPVEGPQGGPRAPLAPPTAYHLYVAANGSDGNPGSEGAPFQTIARGAAAAFPDTTIHVAAGDYPGGILTTVSGKPKERIYYVATTPGTAHIVPPINSAGNTAWDNRGNYVDIVGFDIDGSKYRGGTHWTTGLYGAGSFNSLRHNLVHHIGSAAPCPDGDAAGITIESYFKGVQGEVIGNTVHDIGPASCPASQGIAIHSTALVANNLVYRAGNAGIYMWHDAHHGRIVNNTVAASAIGVLVGGGNPYQGTASNDFTEVSNNIVYDNLRGIVEQGATGPHNSYRNNLVFKHPEGDWRLAPSSRPLASLAAEPRFSAYDRAGTPDFSLAAGSPAIGKGDLQHAHPVDFRGTRRDAKRGADLGALQHGVPDDLE